MGGMIAGIALVIAVGPPGAWLVAEFRDGPKPLRVVLEVAGVLAGSAISLGSAVAASGAGQQCAAADAADGPGLVGIDVLPLTRWMGGDWRLVEGGSERSRPSRSSVAPGV